MKLKKITQNRAVTVAEETQRLCCKMSKAGGVARGSIPWSCTISRPNKGLLHFKERAVSAILPSRLIIKLNKSQI